MIKMTNSNAARNFIGLICVVAALWCAMGGELSFAEGTAVENKGKESKSPAQKVVLEIARLFTEWSGSEDPAAFKQAAGLIDYHEMSVRALGPYWQKLKPDEQAEFTKNFQHLVEERYYKRWHRIFSRGKLSFADGAGTSSEVQKSESENGRNDLVAKTILLAGRRHESLLWRLNNNQGRFRVISLSVGDDDLLDQVSWRFQRRLAKRGLKRLLAWMREESSEEKGEEKGEEKTGAREANEKI